MTFKLPKASTPKRYESIDHGKNMSPPIEASTPKRCTTIEHGRNISPPIQVKGE